MTVKTPAIVLHSVKYGDSSKIIRCYTLCGGIKSLISKGVYSKKNKINPLLTPLNEIEIIFDERPGKDLFFLKEAKMISTFQSVHSLPQKSTVILFLSEILYAVLKEEEANSDLYFFIRDAVLEFDNKAVGFADFHLWFLINLTKNLGIYPNLAEDNFYFNLESGISSNFQPDETFISGMKLEDFKKLLKIDFFAQKENLFNQNQRKILLNQLMKYYELHFPGFRHPKSLEVLQVIFEEKRH